VGMLRTVAESGELPRGLVLRGDRVRLTAVWSHAAPEDVDAVANRAAAEARRLLGRGSSTGGDEGVSSWSDLPSSSPPSSSSKESDDDVDADEVATAAGALRASMAAATLPGVVSDLPTTAPRVRVTEVREVVEAALSWSAFAPATARPPEATGVVYHVAASEAPGVTRQWKHCGTTRRTDARVYALKPGVTYTFRVAICAFGSRRLYSSSSSCSFCSSSKSSSSSSSRASSSRSAWLGGSSPLSAASRRGVSGYWVLCGPPCVVRMCWSR
jgi:hypothetical protein